VSSTTPAAPAPGPAGDADKTWLNADRIFLGMLLGVSAILGLTFYFTP
jgi:hypothetical protein